MIALRLALRQLRGGWHGLRLLILCLALGVAAMAGVRALSDGVSGAMAEGGRAILGGDVSARTMYRPLPATALDGLRARFPALAERVELRSMARAGSGDSTLVEVKAVDALWPIAGEATLEDGAPLTPKLADNGVVVESGLLARLKLKVGDTLTIGDGRFTVAGVIGREPDRLATSSPLLGPRVLMRLDDARAAGLAAPEALVYYGYRMTLPPDLTLDQGVEAAKAIVGPEVRVTDSRNAAPDVTRFLSRLTDFLTLIGLTTLLIGGVGVANATTAFLDRRLNDLAVLKALGASQGTALAVCLWQLLIVALLAVALGLGVGAGIAALAGPMIGAALDLPITAGLTAEGLLLPAAAGFLTALVFSLWPAAQAVRVRPAALFRGLIDRPAGWPGWVPAVVTLIAAAALAALAVLPSDRRDLAGGFVAAALIATGGFAGLAGTLLSGLKRLPHPKRTGLRLALVSLTRAGSSATTLILSLGLGLTVLVAVALVEGGFRSMLAENIPARAPAFFMIDIRPEQVAGLRQTALAVEGASAFETTPMLRGRIISVNGKPAESALIDREKAWVLRSDRGFTWRATPDHSPLIAGDWWPADYAGPPQVSIADDVAQAFGVKPGDTLTVTILGRPITATIRNVREVDWRSLAINFAVVFDPKSLAAAPHTVLATLHATPEAEPQLQSRLPAAYPNITMVRVSDVLADVGRLIGQITIAVRLAAGLTLLAGVLVLAGAVLAGQRRRLADAVILKVLGASTGTIARAHVTEFALLGLVTAALALLLGGLGGWAVLRLVFDLPMSVSPVLVLQALVPALVIAFGAGLLASQAVLRQRPARLLRNE